MTPIATDTAVVAALRAGGAPACELLYDTYGPPIYQYCWLLLRDREVAQTALRDTFVVAHAHIRQLTDPHRFRAWVYALAHAECERHRATVEAVAPARFPRVTGRSRPSPCLAPPSPPQQITVPPSLRIRVLTCVTAPELAAYRAHIARRANRFDRHGYPIPPPPASARDTDSYILPGLIVAACAFLLVLLVILQTEALGTAGMWAVNQPGITG